MECPRRTAKPGNAPTSPSSPNDQAPSAPIGAEATTRAARSGASRSRTGTRTSMRLRCWGACASGFGNCFLTQPRGPKARQAHPQPLPRQGGLQISGFRLGIKVKYITNQKKRGAYVSFKANLLVNNHNFLKIDGLLSKSFLVLNTRQYLTGIKNSDTNIADKT